jgi:hypothetical protein
MAIVFALSTAVDNKSLDASGGGVFLKMNGAAEGALVRAAASTQPLGIFIWQSHETSIRNQV